MRRRPAQLVCLTEKLAAVLGEPWNPAFRMERTEVIRRLSAYAKEHNLQDPRDRRIIRW